MTWYRLVLWVSIIFSGRVLHIVTFLYDILNVIHNGGDDAMQWSEVRRLFPNQFVKLQVLHSYVKNGQEIVEDVAVIEPVADALATKELLKSKDDQLVFHTAHEHIILEIRRDVGLQVDLLPLVLK